MSPRVQLLDVGTQPLPGSIFKLYDALQKFPQIGGVCGEIAVRSPRLQNFIEASQHFEYKISHVMDKGRVAPHVVIDTGIAPGNAMWC